MKILSLETSTRNLSLAISDKEQILASFDVELTGRLSSLIIPEIKKLLKKGRLSLSQIDGYAFSLGPGSFTSLRVGLATVKGLVFADPKPVVGIPSLDVLAQNVMGTFHRHVCVISDAKRKLLYCGLYQKKNGELKRKIKYSLMNPQELVKIIPDDILFVGDGIGVFREEITRACQERLKNFSFADPSDWAPRAIHLALLAQKRFATKKVDDIDRLVPLYLYPEDCQVQR